MTKILTITAFAIATANAAYVQFNNHCTASLWVVNGTEEVKQPNPFEVATGTAYVQKIVGKGNNLGVSYQELYYGTDSPKIVLGTTDDQGRIWWSVAAENGDAFAEGEFNVTSPEPCGWTDTYDQLVHNCPDGDFTVLLDVCI